MSKPKTGIPFVWVFWLVPALFLFGCTARPISTLLAPGPTVLPDALPASPVAPSGAQFDLRSPAGAAGSLLAAARAEGELVTMALPADWCGYGELMRTFEQEYGIPVRSLSPNASSGDELDAVRTLRDQGVGDAPDVLDVGAVFGLQAQQEGLLQPYQVSTWASIPADFKQAEGYWYGGYYGVLAFEINADRVAELPQDWADLLKPQYQGMVALAGDPRSSHQAILTVQAAALANGGSLDDTLPGLHFFRDLYQSGNLTPIIADLPQVLNGAAPITIRWDYLALSDRDKLAGQTKIAVVLPESGLVGGLYVQAISAYARHPNAARLWMEYLYSDKGQMIWLKNYCHPVRFDDLVARQIVPPNLLGVLPSPDLYRQARFPNQAQQNATRLLITDRWLEIVGVQILRP